MKALQTAAALLIATSSAAMAQSAAEPSLIEKAAIIKVANDRCPNVFDAKAFDAVVWLAAAQAKTDEAAIAVPVKAEADRVNALVNSPERQAEFCAWAKQAADMMRPK